MIRDLSLEEMKCVSGGYFHEKLPGIMDDEQHSRFVDPYRPPLYGGGDEVVSTGTKKSGLWGKMKNAFSGSGDNKPYNPNQANEDFCKGVQYGGLALAGIGALATIATLTAPITGGTSVAAFSFAFGTSMVGLFANSAGAACGSVKQ
ncbi:MAG: hypothetical protein V3U57_04405 [Robiginitomaculum sp.]